MVVQDAERTAFNDEEEMKRQLAAQRSQDAADRMREAYNELKYTARDKMGDMREQVRSPSDLDSVYDADGERSWLPFWTSNTLCCWQRR